MKKIFKKLNKKHLAIFIPLSVAGFAVGGITPMFLIAVATGAAYIIWQVRANA